jgi:hypothetical protein
MAYIYSSSPSRVSIQFQHCHWWHFYSLNSQLNLGGNMVMRSVHDYGEVESDVVGEDAVVWSPPCKVVLGRTVDADEVDQRDWALHHSIPEAVGGNDEVKGTFVVVGEAYMDKPHLVVDIHWGEAYVPGHRLRQQHRGTVYTHVGVVPSNTRRAHLH